MGKFVYAVMTVFAIEMALWMFGGMGHSNTNLFNLILNPELILSNPLYTAITLAFLAFAVSAIIPLNSWQINIYALYAGLATAFISFVFSIIHLYGFVFGALSGTFLGETLALQVTMLMCAPFMFFYILAITEWVRAN